ncbi:MAG: EVE domain-containing protein, partial [Gammaproteobacteria bacterium]|nr:EVE domain-containing protein [Gammaproteobacteria bacterium]
MATYLVSWDPTKWDWATIANQAETVERGAPVNRTWACGNARRIFNGDTVYFIRQGREPRGIFARAEVVRGSYEATNVDVQDAQRNRPTLVIDVKFHELLNATQRVGIPRQKLNAGPLKKFVWDIKEQGVKVPDDVAVALDAAWNAALGIKSKKAVAEPQAEEEKATAAASSSGGSSTPSSSEAKPDASSRGEDADAAEQERLRHEREERLRKIKEREASKKKPAATEAPKPKALSETERNE